MTALARMLASPFLAIFMPVLGREFVAAALAQLKASSRERYQRMAAKIYRSVGGYHGCLLGVCAINATPTTVFLPAFRGVTGR